MGPVYLWYLPGCDVVLSFYKRLWCWTLYPSSTLPFAQDLLLKQLYVTFMLLTRYVVLP